MTMNESYPTNRQTLELDAIDVPTKLKLWGFQRSLLRLC